MKRRELDVSIEYEYKLAYLLLGIAEVRFWMLAAIWAVLPWCQAANAALCCRVTFGRWGYRCWYRQRPFFMSHRCSSHIWVCMFRLCPGQWFVVLGHRLWPYLIFPNSPCTIWMQPESMYPSGFWFQSRFHLTEYCMFLIHLLPCILEALCWPIFSIYSHDASSAFHCIVIHRQSQQESFKNGIS